MIVALAALGGCDARCVDFAESCRPDELAPFTTQVVDPDRSEVAGGHVLLTATDSEDSTSFALAIDGAGRPVWWYRPRRTQRVLRARLDRDGRSVVLGVRHPDNDVLDGAFLRIDRETGELLDEVAVLDNHHEHVELPDGRIAFLSRDRVADEWFDTGGELASDVVRVVDFEGGVEPEPLVDVREDLEVEPYWSCNHMRRGSFLGVTLDWSHTNSLVHDPHTGSVTLGIRHFDSIVRLDGAGEVQWWIGVPFSTRGAVGGFQFPLPAFAGPELSPADGARRPRHGHFSDAWDDGVLVFDNGNHDAAPSRIVEYAVDLEADTFTETWSYVHPRGLQLGARGDAIRLPGGNVLVTWSGVGELWEVTREGDVVWTAKSDLTLVRSLFFEEW